MSKERLLCLFVKEWKQLEKGEKPTHFDFNLDEAVELMDKGLLYDDFSPTDKGLALAEKVCKNILTGL
ncbi:MAG: hypothetical protein QMD13_09415 [Candidatus Bathyarchaeia archaeon]|nr:hypothetical protein [Candidatus Bathyarchaeia archaeon]